MIIINHLFSKCHVTFGAIKAFYVAGPRAKMAAWLVNVYRVGFQVTNVCGYTATKH